MELYYNKFTRDRIKLFLNSRYGVTGGLTSDSSEVKIYKPKKYLHISNDCGEVIEYQKVRDWKNNRRNDLEVDHTDARIKLAYITIKFMLGVSVVATGVFLYLLVKF